MADAQDDIVNEIRVTSRASAVFVSAHMNGYICGVGG